MASRNVDVGRAVLAQKDMHRRIDGHGRIGQAALPEPLDLDLPVLAEHLHEAAERNGIQRVTGPAEHDRGDAGREADSELLDGDAGPLGDREVPDLVDQDEDDDDPELERDEVWGDLDLGNVLLQER